MTEIINEKVDLLYRRLEIVEAWKVSKEVEDAVQNNERKHMDDRFDGLDKKIDALEKIVSRVAWFVIGTVLLGVLSLLFKGAV